MMIYLAIEWWFSSSLRYMTREYISTYQEIIHESFIHYPMSIIHYITIHWIYQFIYHIINYIPMILPSYTKFFTYIHIYTYIYIHISHYCWLKLIKYFDPSPPDPSKSSLPIGIGISLQEELKHQVNHLPVGKKNMGVSLKRWIYRKMEDFTG
jgi:hypothetical protein